MVATYNKYKGIEAEGKPEKMLQEMGVAVRDSEGQFIDFGTVMDDLNSKWGSLTQTEKIATAQQVAGIQRYNQFMAMMNNYQMSIDATTTALNSQGSATKENEIYMQSAQAKIEQLKVSLQEMALNFINSDVVKGGIDALRGLVETFDNLPLVIGVATTAFAFFKTQAIADLIEVTAGETGLSIATIGLTSVMNKLKLTFASNPVGVFLLAITSAIALVSHLHNKVEETKESVKNMSSNLSTSLSGYKESETTNKNTADLIRQQEELDSKIRSSVGNNEELTKAKAELLLVEQKIAQALPATANGLDTEGKAISENIELNKQLLAVKEAQAQADLRKTVKEADSGVEDAKSQYDNATKKLEEYKAQRTRITNDIAELNKMDTSNPEVMAELSEAQQNLISLSSLENDQKSLIADSVAGLLQANITYDQFNKTIGTTTGEHKELIDMTKYNINSINNETDATKKSTQALDENIKKAQEAIAKKYDTADASKN